MINANEARIVTNENEYKNVLREEEEARLAAIREMENEMRRMKAEQEINDKVFEPIGEAIAQRAAEGYSNISLRVYNSTYTLKDSTSFNIDATYFSHYTNTFAYVNEYVRLLTKAIIHRFEALGYRIVIENMPSCGYNVIGYIHLHW